MHNIGHKIILIRTICSISDTQIRPATRDTQCREHWNTIDKSRARYRKFCKKNTKCAKHKCYLDWKESSSCVVR